jgi:hypothetical protein
MAKQIKQTSNTDALITGATQNPTAHQIVTEMIGAGVPKSRIAQAVGVTDMTILYVSKRENASLGKIAELQSAYAKWKAGELDLSSTRGKKVGVSAPVEVKSPEAIKPVPKKRNRRKKAVVAVGKKPAGEPKKIPVVQTSPAGFQVPEITSAMITHIENQISNLQHQLKYMKDIIRLKKKFKQ